VNKSAEITYKGSSRDTKQGEEGGLPGEEVHTVRLHLKKKATSLSSPHVIKLFAKFHWVVAQELEIREFS
jgi:hypothetical protein